MSDFGFPVQQWPPYSAGHTVATGPEYDQSHGDTMRQYTDCPFDPDALPECGPDNLRLPRPLFEGQEMVQYLRDKWGKLRGSLYLRAFLVRGALLWKDYGVFMEAQDRWSRVVPFPS